MRWPTVSPCEEFHDRGLIPTHIYIYVYIPALRSASRSSFSEGQLLGGSVSDGELVRLSPGGRHVLEEGEIPRRPRDAGAVFSHGEPPPYRSCSDQTAETKSGDVLQRGDQSAPGPPLERPFKFVSAHSALGVKRAPSSGYTAIDLESTWQRSVVEEGCGEATAKWPEEYNSGALNWHRRRGGRGARSSTDGSCVTIGDSVESGDCIEGVSPGEVSPSSTGSLFGMGRSKEWGGPRRRDRESVGVDRQDCNPRDGLRGRLDDHRGLQGVYTELQGIASTSSGGDAGDEKTLEQTGEGDSSAVSRLSLEEKRRYSAVVMEGAIGSSSASGSRGQASSRYAGSTGEYRANRER